MYLILTLLSSFTFSTYIANESEILNFDSMLSAPTIVNLQERQKILLRAADVIEKHIDELATLETWDNGKPYSQAAEIEVPMLVRLIRYYAGMRDKEYILDFNFSD